MTDRPNRPPKSRPVAVAEALAGYLKRAGLARRIGQAQVIPEWPGLVGPQIAAVTTPESITPDGVLFVRVATSSNPSLSNISTWLAFNPKSNTASVV